MPRERFKTLTEQMFYILLCLNQERRGVEILEMVRTLTAGRVSIGSGTLYDLLEQFTAEGMIQEGRAEGRRRDAGAPLPAPPGIWVQCTAQGPFSSTNAGLQGGNQS